MFITFVLFLFLLLIAVAVVVVVVVGGWIFPSSRLNLAHDERQLLVALQRLAQLVVVG